MALRRALTRLRRRTREDPASRRWDVVTAELKYDQRKYTLHVFADNHLDDDGFGVVCKGEKVDSQGTVEAVAVKLINVLDGVHQKLVDREIETWKRLQHTNVQPFYGLSSSLGVRQVGLVSPLADKGNMKDFIAQNPRTTDRLPLLVQVAEGLKYLHLQAKIVHGDLKCTHILITGEGLARISCFRLSTSVEKGDTDSAHTITRYIVAVAFAAPELLADSGDQKLSRTTSSDVYAFGRLIYEAYAAEEPWHGTDPETLRGKVLEGEPPPREVKNPGAVPLGDALWQLCERCWDRNPSQRPDCRDILQELGTAHQGEIQTAASK